MLMRRMMMGAVLILTVLVGWSTARLWGQNPPAAPAGPTEMQQLAEARAEIAKKALSHLDQLTTAGFPAVDADDARARWSRRLAEAQIAAARDDAGRLAAAQAYLTEAQKLRDRATSMYRAGSGNYQAVLEADFAVAEAESKVAEFKPR